MKKAVVIYSGGMDSFTVLHKALRENDQISAISFNYGQRHAKELIYAKSVCNELSIKHHIIDLTTINPLLSGSALTDDIDVPEGHYEEASMQQTVVPNRNMIMLSIAVGYAVSIEAESVLFWCAFRRPCNLSGLQDRICKSYEQRLRYSKLSSC